MTANMAFGSHAARSGLISAFPPTAFVSWIMRRKMIVVARLTPMPYAVPPRCVLVARGAPKRAMTRQVIGNGDLERPLHAQQVRVAPRPLERRDEPRQLAEPHLLRVARPRHQVDRLLGRDAGRSSTRS